MRKTWKETHFVYVLFSSRVIFLTIFLKPIAACDALAFDLLSQLGEIKTIFWALQSYKTYNRMTILSRCVLELIIIKNFHRTSLNNMDHKKVSKILGSK